jgi:hypothetical protein
MFDILTPIGYCLGLSWSCHCEYASDWLMMLRLLTKAQLQRMAVLAIILLISLLPIPS